MNSILLWTAFIRPSVVLQFVSRSATIRSIQPVVRSFARPSVHSLHELRGWVIVKTPPYFSWSNIYHHRRQAALALAAERALSDARQQQSQQFCLSQQPAALCCGSVEASPLKSEQLVAPPAAATVQFILFGACTTDHSHGNYIPEELACDDVIDVRVAAGSRFLIAVLMVSEPYSGRNNG
jgi:hypothetical protein